MSCRTIWLLVMALLLVAGCDRGPQLAPVRGKVLLDGEPLKFGSVMFQPPDGQPARADIQSDGSFQLKTPGLGDGAVVGKNMVRVTCFSNQAPDAVIDTSREMPSGDSLIPLEYNNFNTSGLVVDVPHEGRDDVVLELSSKKPGEP